MKITIFGKKSHLGLSISNELNIVNFCPIEKILGCCQSQTEQSLFENKEERSIKGIKESENYLSSKEIYFEIAVSRFINSPNKTESFSFNCINSSLGKIKEINYIENGQINFIIEKKYSKFDKINIEEANSLFFEKKYTKFDKIHIEAGNSLFFEKKIEKNYDIQKNESLIFIHKTQKNDKTLSSSYVNIPQKRKKYFIINEFKTDYIRSFKIAIKSVLILILILCLTVCFISHMNINQNFSKNYFKNQSLFKWELVYSKN